MTSGTIINATLDPLRGDGDILEEALEKAGVPAERRIYTDVPHEFFGAAADAQAYAGERPRASFG
jgi:acetyl esterase